MPVLEKIAISNFRNIEFQELEFSPNINCISGNNGEGKTNLLDAIYYLSMTKSAFSSGDRYNFRHGQNTFSMCGTYRMNSPLVSRFAIKVTPGEKKLKRDDNAYARISEHIGVLPIVMVSPADTVLVSESGEERRRFINAVLSQIDRGYLSDIQQYNRLLLQRNTMLKEITFAPDLMAVLDERLSALAAPVHEARKAFATSLEPIVNEYYARISGGAEKVGIRYVSDLDKAPLSELLSASFEKDTLFKYTTVGIQRDDFVFEMDGHPIRRYGSQGQQKSFLVALKFAQYDIMKRSYGFAPTLLLDDVFDKLDPLRIANLLAMVSSEDFGQIFITDCNKVRLRGIVDALTTDRKYFETQNGCFSQVE